MLVMTKVREVVREKGGQWSRGKLAGREGGFNGGCWLLGGSRENPPMCPGGSRRLHSRWVSQFVQRCPTRCPTSRVWPVKLVT
eukprot:6282857-Prymnesium_polylepis.1